MHQFITMKALGRADCGNDFSNALLCCNEGKANIFLVKTKYFSNIFIKIYDRI